MPDDAYRFAKSEVLGLAPFNEQGQPTRQIRIDRPLDFAAVTDHAEWIGELGACRTQDSAAYASLDCRILRGEVADSAALKSKLVSDINRGLQRGVEEFCGVDASRCRHDAGLAWQRIQAAAAAHQDRSERCTFTTFNAWEYSAMPGLSKVHRNVILRNESVPELPISWMEEPDPLGLWQKLQTRCNETDTGCEALTIPHNPNLSNGQLFTVVDRDQPLVIQQRRAELQAQLEPLVEIAQSKGESECRSGMYQILGGEDEYCGFEKVRFQADGTRPEDCAEGTGTGALLGNGCQSRLDFVRYGLIEGLREQARLGVNPYRFGFVGGTDTHNATPGATAEHNYAGHNALRDATPQQRLTRSAYVLHKLRNPGGLMGVWAEENSRDAIFDAMQRRETFATSGGRVKPRFFAGWQLPETLCQSDDAIALAYAGGVPMGGELGGEDFDRPDKRGPLFFASSLRDPGAENFAGSGLQRMQIIKGEVAATGEFRETVIDIATDPGLAVEVDAACQPTRGGATNLCTVWRDPQWNSARNTVYYLRVLEQPSCRWSARQCMKLPEKERPEACADGSLPRTIQERAWTSPIWYVPGAS